MKVVQCDEWQLSVKRNGVKVNLDEFTFNCNIKTYKNLNLLNVFWQCNKAKWLIKKINSTEYNIGTHSNDSELSR